jgi:hypothetical protein
MGEPGQDVTIEGPVAQAGAVSLTPDQPPPQPFTLEVKTGKKPATRDPRDLMYAAYRRPQNLAVAAEAHWGHGLPYDILGNGQFGDCVEAGAAHGLQVAWDRASKSESAFVPTAQLVLGDYSGITGFNAADPATDQGTDMRQACGYWRNTGIEGQYKIGAYLAVRPDNEVHAREAVQYYCGLYTGLAMPVSAQAQTGNGIWDVVSGPDSAPGSWGGHCVWATGFDSEGLWCVTWGFIQKMSWNFFGTYCDEAWVLLFDQWIRSSGYSPSGLSMGQLLADMNSLA